MFLLMDGGHIDRVHHLGTSLLRAPNHYPGREYGKPVAGHPGGRYPAKFASMHSNPTSEMGTVDLAVVEFSTAKFDGSIADALANIVDRDLVRILDLVLVEKTANGELNVIELADADNYITDRFDAVQGEVMWLLSDADVNGAAAHLAPDTTGLLIVWENTWAREIRRALLDSGGRLVVHDPLDIDTVARAIAATPEA